MTQPPTTTVCAANPEQSQFVGVFAVSGFIMCSTADEATSLLERLDPDRAGGDLIGIFGCASGRFQRPSVIHLPSPTVVCA